MDSIGSRKTGGSTLFSLEIASLREGKVKVKKKTPCLGWKNRKKGLAEEQDILE